MNPNTLFLHRCDRLAILVESDEHVELLDIADILRQFFFDEKALVDVVNKNGIKLSFKVGMWPPMPTPSPESESLEDGVDPQSRSSNWPSVLLSQSTFGKYPVSYWRGHYITIKDVVKYATNVAGAVHYDPSPRPEYLVQHALSQHASTGGLPLGIRQLKAIGRVSLRGLYPLIEDVKTRHQCAQTP